MSGFEQVAKFLAKKESLCEKEIFKIMKQDFIKGTRKNNFNIILKKLNINEDYLSELVKIYRNHKPNIRLYKDAEIILKTLKKNKKLALITDGYIQTQKNKINILKINHFFEIIVINDINNTNKLDVKPFLHIIKKFNINPNKIAFIGDNPLKDFKNTKKLGILTLRIKRNNGIYHNIKVNSDFEADYIIKNLTEIYNFFNGENIQNEGQV